MAAHFYSMNKAKVDQAVPTAVTADTATTAGSQIELRVEDGELTRRQIHEFCKRMADYFASHNPIAGIAR